MIQLNETHDAGLRSWVPGAIPGQTDFPIQNLPFGAFSLSTAPDVIHIGMAIGDQILALPYLLDKQLLSGPAAEAAMACQGNLNALMSMGHVAASALRLAVSRLLRIGAQREQVQACLVPMNSVQMHLPVRVDNFTDFFTSVNHCNNASRVFDRNKGELPNFRSLPIAYHGRASTVVVSDTLCQRPKGQMKAADGQVMFGPTRCLDYELEVGCYVSKGNPRNQPVSLADAEQHLFGMSLVNDWSARDIQGWEMTPLGPFLGKSFLTTVSPWVVTLEALAPFRCPAADRGVAAELLPYLHDADDRSHGGMAIDLEVAIASAAMRAQHLPAMMLGAPTFADQYWTIFQMLTHHTSNGCNLLPGDLLASGTISGAITKELGCLLELTEGGRQPVTLPSGESRGFLHDGDEVILRGHCRRDGFVTIGFGECRGIVQPAV